MLNNLLNKFNKSSKDKLLLEHLKVILDGDYERIIVWRSPFGWDVPLFQRPQHIARELAKVKCLVLYEVTTATDKVRDIKFQEDNIYLVNFSNYYVNTYLHDLMKKITKPKYIQIYSTNWSMTLTEMQEYINNGYEILYEYIDEISPELSGTEEIPLNIKDKYQYIMSHKNILVVVTATELYNDVVSKRGKNNLIYSSNGVNYNFFANIKNNVKIMPEFQKIANKNKPIIGYYGALASWFDYEMVEYLAEKRPNYQIVLFGIKYDDSYNKSSLDKFDNIHFLGNVNYAVLPNHAQYFNVCTIPFLINDITQSTSPLKLFEYMSLSKPIVTTDMVECRKYKSVMIAKNKDEFLELVDKSLTMNIDNNKEYFDLLKKEALENTWKSKANLIVNELKKNERD